MLHSRFIFTGIKELEKILTVSRRKNVQLDIIGLLVIKAHCFLQALGGDGELVLRLYEKLSVILDTTI